MDKPIEDADLEMSNDMKILATAIDYDKNVRPDEVIFTTNDMALLNIASLFFGEDSIQMYKPKEEEEYHGFKEISMNSEELSDFYTDYSLDKYGLITNEYLIIRDSENNNEIIDAYRNAPDGTIKQVYFQSFDSKMFGSIKPKDVYQKIAMDSLKNNQITLLGGYPGSGKTLLALGYLFSQLERGKIDKIIIFINPVGAKDTAKLGFYKGTVREKILATQAGHVLSSKFGDMSQVERLLDEGTVEIIPAVDSRGYEVPQGSGVYILEAQNLTSDTLRMLLQRVSEGVQVIIDGDRNEQVDMDIYQEDNGMKKVCETFKGESIYGQVDLQKIYRSRIATIAERMR